MAAELASISAPAETSGSPAKRGESRAIYAAICREVMALSERAERPARARRARRDDCMEAVNEPTDGNVLPREGPVWRSLLSAFGDVAARLTSCA